MHHPLDDRTTTAACASIAPSPIASLFPPRSRARTKAIDRRRPKHVLLTTPSIPTATHAAHSCINQRSDQAPSIRPGPPLALHCLPHIQRITLPRSIMHVVSCLMCSFPWPRLHYLEVYIGMVIQITCLYFSPSIGLDNVASSIIE